MRQDDVALIRQTVTKVTRLLSDRDIRVTQRGMNAFVSYDKNGVPDHVNIPYLPDGADDVLIRAVQGFLDHEVAHLLISDFQKLVEGNQGGQKLGSLHNIIEDTFIEREMANRFRGSQYNLDRVADFVIRDTFEPTYQKAKASGDPRIVFRALICPAFRAWAGHEPYGEFMQDKWADFPLKQELDFARQELPKLKNTTETLDLARRVLAILDKQQPEPEPGDGEPCDGGAAGESQDDRDKPESKPGQGDEAKSDDSDDKEQNEKGDEKAEGDGDGADGDGAESDQEAGDDEDTSGDADGDGQGDKGDDEQDGGKGAAGSDADDTNDTENQEDGDEQQDDGGDPSGDDGGDDRDAGEDEGSGDAGEDDRAEDDADGPADTDGDGGDDPGDDKADGDDAGDDGRGDPGDDDDGDDGDDDEAAGDAGEDDQDDADAGDEPHEDDGKRDADGDGDLVD